MQDSGKRVCAYCDAKIEPDDLPCPNPECRCTRGKVWHRMMRHPNGKYYYANLYWGIRTKYWYWESMGGVPEG